MFNRESGREIRCCLREGGWVTANLENKVALIVGAGSGLSASIARSFAGAGMKIALAARSVDDLGPLAAKIGAATFAADASDREAVRRLFADLGNSVGDPY